MKRLFEIFGEPFVWGCVALAMVAAPFLVVIVRVWWNITSRLATAPCADVFVNFVCGK